MSPKRWFIPVMLVAAVLIFAAIPSLTSRVDPVFPGVQYESDKSNPYLSGMYCSGGFAVMSSATGGSLGFMTASHCTDPGSPKDVVFQPYYDVFASDRNNAGYTQDSGTNDAYNEADKSKPDAAIWWVANRKVDARVPVGLCRFSTEWAKPAGVIPDVWVYYGPSNGRSQGYATQYLLDVWKIGKSTGCTGSSHLTPIEEDHTLIYDVRISGRVFTLPLNELYATHGDSGGIVFTCYKPIIVNTTDTNGNKKLLLWWGPNTCPDYIYIVGTIVAAVPPSSPVYAAIQQADYSLKYYNVVNITMR